LALAHSDTKTPQSLALQGIDVKRDGQPRGLLDLLGRDHREEAIYGAFPWLHSLSSLVLGQLEVEALYSGYLNRQAAEVRQLRATEAFQIPDEIDYASVGGLSTEAREKLHAVRPTSLASLSRIPGISPPTVMAVLGHLRRAQG
jgi:tRNA uridine 5-carboxymethylaminomethyl modification enzyme